MTVPALVYILSVEPVAATAYSLFIVGLTALVGSFQYMRKQLVSYRTAVIFAIPAFIAVYMTRRFLVPAIPDHIMSIAGLDLTKDLFIMLLFAILMVAAAVSMIRDKKSQDTEGEPEFNYPLILLEGFVVGILTGLVGAGGGFLIIPALVLLARLPMNMAVGTSLLIIAAKSLIGFLGDVSEMNLDWTLLLKFTAFTIVGIFAGIWLTKYIPGKKLKPAFGWFVLVMGVYIISKELYQSL